MTLTAAVVAQITKTLSDSGYDVAAGLSDATLNSFLSAHWKSEEGSAASVYVGNGRADEVGLSWHYEVRSPATLNSMPIASATFSRIYRL